jgi:hypothetical protein
MEPGWVALFAIGRAKMKKIFFLKKKFSEKIKKIVLLSRNMPIWLPLAGYFRESCSTVSFMIIAWWLMDS